MPRHACGAARSRALACETPQNQPTNEPTTGQNSPSTHLFGKPRKWKTDDGAELSLLVCPAQQIGDERLSVLAPVRCRCLAKVTQELRAETNEGGRGSEGMIG